MMQEYEKAFKENTEKQDDEYLIKTLHSILLKKSSFMPI